MGDAATTEAFGVQAQRLKGWADLLIDISCEKCETKLRIKSFEYGEFSLAFDIYDKLLLGR